MVNTFVRNTKFKYDHLVMAQESEDPILFM